MCGITGFAAAAGIRKAGEKILAMAQTLNHRGPDHLATWTELETHSVALGHTRLSVMDPKSRSHQPMTSSNGRFVITFNGEIYNHLQFRSLLASEGVRFSTTSDTEALVEAINAWGIERTLVVLEGMFAFAAWDVVDRKLWLCRDKFGIKPCYWMWHDNALVFGSQIKSLLEWSGQPLQLDQDSVASLVDRGFIMSPRSIFLRIKQLEPGQVLSLKIGEEPNLQFFWSLRSAKQQQAKGRAYRPEVQLRRELDEILNDTIKQYMQADVPTGCFLSGGFNSSLVAAIACRHSARPIKTFAVGFAERQWDESWKARRVAKYLGSDHHEIILDAQGALEIVEDIPKYYDEPFADFSQLPTLAVSRLAREQVTVSLSGDGGDELFGGYDRYGWCQQFWELLSSLEPDLREKALKFLECNRVSIRSSAAQMNHTLFEVSKHLPFGYPVATFRDLYSRVTTTGPGSLFDGDGIRFQGDDLFWNDSDEFLTLTDRMQLQDMRRYMGDGILTKVDRASMSVGLEVRVPLLSEQVVDYAFGLPEWAKYAGQSQRDLQKTLSYDYIPRQLLDYPKMGFGFPIDEWLRTSLREWAEDLISVQSLENVPYLKSQSVRALWLAHSSRHSDEHWRLWPVLMYVQWYRHWSHFVAH